MPRHVLSFVLLALFVQMSAAQTADTVIARPDTSLTAPADTVAGGVDTTVVYTAKDSIIYSMKTRFMNLFGEGATNYQQMSLKAERIQVNWDSSTLTAAGVADTARADSVIGSPVIKDAGEEYLGDTVKYNFKSKKGRITLGKTEIEEGHYIGEQIKKVDVNMLYVEDGRYTTCDKDHPHFYFFSPKMKLYVRDKVVVEPVYFYVADVPVFALPFGVFPSRGGRASGIIAPAFGEDNRTGSYLSHLGHYWAISDYFDFATSFDLTTRGGWANRSRLNYALRYNFTGSLSGEYRKVINGKPGDPGYQSSTAYDATLIHNQQIDPSSRVDVNFRFSSGNYGSYSSNIQDILRQNIFSAASYSKTWERSNRSLSVSITRDQSLTNGDISGTLPAISFTQSQIFPFRSRSRSRGLTGGGSAERPWIEMFGLNYGASYANMERKVTTFVDSVFSPVNPVEFGRFSDYRRTTTQSLRQNIGFSISPKVGYITVTPSLGFTDVRTWTKDRLPVRDRTDSTITMQTTNPQSIAGNLSTGISASTRFYGIFQPGVFGITAFRHTVNPTLGLTYSKQVYGENMRKYSMLGSFNMSNNFEMKVQSSDTVDAQKIQLMNVGMGFSYDFAKDSLNFSEVSLSYRTDIGQYLGISGGASYNLYEFDRTVNRRVNRYLLSDHGKFGDLTSVSLSLSTSFRGEKKQAPAAQGLPAKVQAEQAAVSGTGLTPPVRQSYQTIYDREEADFSIPWNLTLSFTFSQSQADPRFKFRSSSANASLSFNLTELWQIGTFASYDFVNKKHFVPSVDVTRDLHCWTMRFTWFPMGVREGYKLELRVKAPQLQDIKVTKQNAQRGIY